MPAGRPPDPIALQALKGRVRKDGVQVAADGMPMNMNEPQPGGTLDPNRPPKELKGDKVAVQAWKDLLRITNQVPGWIFVSDGPIVLMYAKAFSIYVETMKYMSEHQVKDPRSRISLINGMNTAQRMLLECIRSIGLSPVDRSKIMAKAGAFGGVGKKEEDPAEKYRREMVELEKAGKG